MITTSQNTAADLLAVTEEKAARRTGSRWRRSKLPIFLAVVIAWAIVWIFTRGTQTLALYGQETTDFHEQLSDLRTALVSARGSNPVMQFTASLADAMGNVFEYLQTLVSRPAFPRPVPQVGWLGVIAVVTWVAYAAATWRTAALVLLSFLSFAYLGYWEDSLDMLIVVFCSVGVAILIGLPIAMLTGVNRRVDVVFRPVLDTLQTLPTIIYLLPLVMFFGIGAPVAVVATFLYAAPPLIRIAGHAIGAASPETIEASDSMGQTDRKSVV